MPACVGLKGFDVINLSYKQIKNGIWSDKGFFFNFREKKSSQMSRIYIEKPKKIPILLLLKWQNLSEKNKLDNQGDNI
jgi:hypothetical protein